MFCSNRRSVFRCRASTAAATSLGVTIVGGVASTAMTVMQTINSQKTASVMAKAQTNQAITNKQLAEQAMLFEAQGLAEKESKRSSSSITTEISK